MLVGFDAKNPNRQQINFESIFFEVFVNLRASFESRPQDEHSGERDLRRSWRVVHNNDCDEAHFEKFVEFLSSKQNKLIEIPMLAIDDFSLQYDNSDSLSKSFNELKEAVLQTEDLKLISPEIFLAPFLEAIRSEETTGPITSISLSAVNKFLSYGLIGKFRQDFSSFNMDIFLIANTSRRSNELK